ncbi:MAG: type II toxin-antitoxin system VapC family toxin [bacterium]|nr:type II toxin-antitoxin system VapC family toxin [bacterium]
MICLLDTVAVVRHLSGAGRIGREAARILDTVEEGSDLLLVSAVSLMEILYLSEKNRIPLDLGNTLDKIKASECYAVVDLNAEILKVAATLEYRELHDRLILATAKWFGVAVLSSDRDFEYVEGLQVIWD